MYQNPLIGDNDIGKTTDALQNEQRTALGGQ